MSEIEDPIHSNASEDIAQHLTDFITPSEEAKERGMGAMVALIIVAMFIGLVLVKQVLIPYLQDDEIPLE